MVNFLRQQNLPAQPSLACQMAQRSPWSGSLPLGRPSLAYMLAPGDGVVGEKVVMPCSNVTQVPTNTHASAPSPPGAVTR